MTEQEKAEFVLNMIRTPGLTFPTAQAREVVQVLDWLEDLATPAAQQPRGLPAMEPPGDAGGAQ